ncbi:hypothetical protein N7537_001752 [Penicillium hordei]|uniref:HTH CENPB-type domain-containing protein n=1 Tax=Penicillium hordei TaxID=40994 RepID=A0AAD6EG41_9EURO|nr:uncharacterized protein N7537_001752 [Penicillium hordei]KAJ5616638.1 hypothetical protein N7537_001752 [Penicillium hordei]
MIQFWTKKKKRNKKEISPSGNRTPVSRAYRPRKMRWLSYCSTTWLVDAYHQSDKPNIAKLAREFGVPYGRLRCRLHGRKPNSAVERALKSWIASLHNAYTSPTPEIVERAANHLLKDRVVSESWVYRFIKTLPPEMNYTNLKPTEKSRDNSENFGALFLWFNNLSTVMKKHQFLPNEIFNWDETGFQIGQGKRQKVITSSTRCSNPTGGQVESITGIECIAADGWGSLHMVEWYENIQTPDFRIKPTPNGWIDDETALQ